MQEEREMSTCGEVMTSHPVCCLPDETADKAAQFMKSEDVGSIPVVQDRQSNRLIGIVTDRDLAVRVVAERRNAETTKVRDVMTRNPVTCRANDDVRMAFNAMVEHKVRRIPVVDETGSVIGIIAQADVATRTDEPANAIEVVREISISSETGEVNA
jgi:CBS domain-containing protein